MITNPNRVWIDLGDGQYNLYLMLNGKEKHIAILKQLKTGRWYMHIQKDFAYIDTDYYLYCKPTEEDFMPCESDRLETCKDEVEGLIEYAMKRYWRLGIMVQKAWSEVEYDVCNWG